MLRIKLSAKSLVENTAKFPVLEDKLIVKAGSQDSVHALEIFRLLSEDSVGQASWLQSRARQAVTARDGGTVWRPGHPQGCGSPGSFPRNQVVRRRVGLSSQRSDCKMSINVGEI